ncbi:methyl-accepting chemotaxis protein [Clostridium sp. USBA 49]|uniref:methyl-accepting chemotaxis protein n=1 Tax=Clostridium sp. USBA 49 TaxID=1881060 RepID=UPI0009CA7B4C|nr:methyl-accepting chemotaxis protein [Clostridium sp. USBA 49]SKA87239.1 methyl-accepting chemotaxis protein [Clostridium sp. USBA 49]
MKLNLDKFFKFKLKGKLMSAYILLFCIFSITVFLVINVQVNKIITDTSRQQLKAASKMGTSFLNQSYIGDFNLINGKLYRGDVPLETDTIIVDKISKETETFSAIFNLDKCVSTSIKDKNGKRYLNIKVPDYIKKSVINNKKEEITEIIIDNKKYEGMFTPLIDGKGKAIGMWLTAVDKSKAEETIFNVNFIVGITTIIFILLGVIGINIFINILLKNVNKVSNTINELGQGKLNINCNINTKDEIKDIADSVNITIENIRNLVEKTANIIEKLKTTSNTISIISEEIGFSSEEIASAMGNALEGSVVQTEKIEECDKTIDTLSQKIHEMNIQIENTIKNGEYTKKSTETGINALEVLKEKLNKNHTSTLILTKQIDKLSKGSKVIENIISTIKDIANKTNLLALNASIEAARAGEAGRGFTVVAEEIRNLAEQSKNSTEEISIIIQDITKAIKESKIHMDESNEIVELSNNSMQQTEKAFMNIKNNTNILIKEILILKNNLNEVRDVESKVISSMENILEVTKQSKIITMEVNSSTEKQSFSINQIIGSLQEENSVINELTETISMFKI